MPLTVRIIAFAAVVLLVAVSAVLILRWLIEQDPELGPKPVYAHLQGVEFRHRSTPVSGLLILDEPGHDGKILGVPTGDREFPNAWIALWKVGPNGTVLMVPGEANLKIDCAQVDDFLAREIISETISSYLSRHCS